VVDDLESHQHQQHRHEVPQKVEIPRNTPTVIFEIFSDVPRRPFAVLQLLQPGAAGTARTVGVVDTRPAAVVVELRQ